MKVSVIIPMYNSDKYVSETIDSVLAQSFTDFELILINDFSTDNTETVVKPYLAKDKRIILINNTEGKGQSGARNSGIKLAKGKYIALIDSDDVMLPTRLEKQVAYMDSHQNVGVLGTWIKEFGKSDLVWENPTDSDTIKAQLIICPAIANPSAMIRKSVLEINNIQYRSEYDYAEDYELWIQLKDVTDFANLPEVLTMYRIHGENVSIAGKEKMINAWKTGVSRLLRQLDISPTDEFLSMLDAFESNDFTKFDEQWKKRAEEFCRQLINQNNFLAVFPKEAFAKLIGERVALLNQQK